MKQRINSTEIEFSALSMVDDYGKIFYWQGRIFRAIKRESVVSVMTIFASGMIDELAQNNLFPKSWITDYELDGYGLVVEHEAISSVTYPYEWSFSMLRDAAAMVLKTNIIALKYGYQTKDCHGFNVVFDGVMPKYVDLGSFIKRPEGFKGWIAFDEFLEFYYYPLRIWAGGNGYIARKLLQGGTELPHINFLLYNHPLLRVFAHYWLKWLVTYYHMFRSISVLPLNRLNVQGFRWLKSLIILLSQRGLIPLQSVNLASLLRKIERLRPKKVHSLWGNYHDELIQDGKILSTPRFDRVVNLVNELGVVSVTELAGNQGILSMALLERTSVERVICTDYDENAIDTLYRIACKRRLKIIPALLDFVYPVLTSFGRDPNERLRSEMLVALAITHHLILTTKLSLDHVFETMASYTTRYVCIEFMPLGLYDGKFAPPFPPWYSVDWFREHFIKHFSLLLEEQLEENRILFVGELSLDTSEENQGTAR